MAPLVRPGEKKNLSGSEIKPERDDGWENGSSPRSFHHPPNVNNGEEGSPKVRRSYKANFLCTISPICIVLPFSKRR
jgi:hypothetical protein